MLARTVRYWLICNIAASSKVWIFWRHCSRASRFCLSCPSIALNSSSVKPVNPAGGIGIGGRPNGGRIGIPKKGGGKGNPGRVALGCESEPTLDVSPGLGEGPVDGPGLASSGGLPPGAPGTGGNGPIGGHRGNIPGGKGGRIPGGKLGCGGITGVCCCGA